MLQPKRTKVAIIGSGISGLSTAWALHQTKAYEVHIYEAADRLGGHTNTVPFVHKGKQTMVDTGFMVLNTTTYRSSTPYLLSFPLSIDNCSKLSITP
jgi:predicted NAD/FAD-binding protein